MTDVQSNYQQEVTSKDGTAIAYERTGDGPAVIIVAAALDDRSGTKRMTKQLAAHFTVVTYDRRGRGASGDKAPYAVQREVEDIEALIDEVGGSAFLFGSSSGAVLALDAANKLTDKVRKQALFEPPFIVDDSRPPMPDDFLEQVSELVSADQRSGVVVLFMSKGMGIPRIFVNMMRIMPGWSKMKSMAHTLPYDLTIMGGTQSGKPLPAMRWASTTASTLVMTGGRSGTFFHTGAQALADMLPDAQHQILPGQSHAAVVMRPKALMPLLLDFFKG